MDFDKQLEAMRRRHAEVPQQSTSLPEPMQGDVLLYQSDDQNISVSVYFYNETFWMNVKAMAELFECSSDNISVHLKNIYFEQELDEISTTEFFSVVQTEGNRRVKRSVKHYSLDAIISVGYRVNSKKATKFRQWATKTLKEYMIKGFVINDDMLKNGTPFGQDYFDELLERIKMRSGPVNEDFIRRSPIFIPSVVMITTRTARSLRNSLRLYRINFSLP